MKWLVFTLILKPLIKRNYRMRYEGKLPDEWYWADAIATSWKLFLSEHELDEVYGVQ